MAFFFFARMYTSFSIIHVSKKNIFITELLKIAEKKQHEPIIIEPKVVEEERPLTKKQKKELLREKEYRERKEKQITEKPPTGTNRIPKLNGTPANTEKPTPQNANANKIPKINNYPKPESSKSNNGAISKSNVNSSSAVSNKIRSEPKPVNGDRLKPSSNQIPPSKPSNRPLLPTKSPTSTNIPSKTSISNGVNRPSLDKRKFDTNQNKIAQKPPTKPSEKPKQNSQNDPIKPKKFLPGDTRLKEFPPRELKPKEFPPRDLKPKEFPPRDLKPKEFPPRDLKPKQFPPNDVHRKKKPLVVGNKRRILDDDDEDEYDSEMDDFIDDGPEEGADYSRYISEIFGYDKSKYRYMDDDVDNMESTFAQQMKEEIFSTKMGGFLFLFFYTQGGPLV